MRLKLLVRRHNLPDAAIIWAIDTAVNPTVAQLVEQINDVIPLESGGDWGLEDYAVELINGGTNFECLHFQQLKSILHEDDEVLIRPLLTQDLKLRKVSGRHQITSDGKHLFDGVPFGRSKTRREEDRPAVEIPPRKRRRIMDSEQSQLNELDDTRSCGADDDRRLVLRADTDDDESDDDDYEPSEDRTDEDTDEDLSNEEFQHDDSFGSEDSLLDDLPHDKMRIVVRELRDAFPKAPMSVCKTVLLHCDGDFARAWEILIVGFKPSKPRKFVERKLMNRGIQVSAESGDETRKSTRPKSQRMLEENTTTSLNDVNGSSNSYSDSFLEYYDQHGLPSGSISIGNVLPRMANIVADMEVSKGNNMSSLNDGNESPSDHIKSLFEVFTQNDLPRSPIAIGNVPPQMTKIAADMEVSNLNKSPDTSSSQATRKEGPGSIATNLPGDSRVVSEGNESGESSNSDDDISSVRNDDSSSPESNTDASDSESVDSSSTSEDSESSEASSDSDSEPDQISSRSNVSNMPATSKYNSGRQDKLSSKKLSTETKPLVPPGAGKISTHKRNRRRRIKNAFLRFHKKGILPAGTAISEFMKLDMNQINTPEDAVQAVSVMRTASSELANEKSEISCEGPELEARRQTLLAAVATGDAEAGSISPSSNLNDTNRTATERTEREMADAVVKDKNLPSNTPLHSIAGDDARVDEIKLSRPQVLSVTAQLAPSGTELTESVSRPQKRKLDVGAASRLVFGALGVRTPRTKAEKEKAQNDLTKRTQPLRPSNLESVVGVMDLEDEDDDPDAWKKGINLKAIECCDDGIELTPAPFPFIQRWDPQQSNYWKNGGKRKRYQISQACSYEGEQASKKRKRYRNNSEDDYQYVDAQPDANEKDDYWNNVADVHDEATQPDRMCSDGVEGEVDDQLMRDVKEAAASNHAPIDDDLPRLPEDITILPNLSVEQVNTGMVIAFKQLELSQATNWQPQMSEYQTAVVIKVLDHGLIDVTLAKRDRDRSEKRYDELTGQRVYGKFEMPYDDDDEDDGFRNLTFAELVDAKIVQQAPEDLSPSKVPIEASAQTSHTKTSINGESTTLSSADEPKASVEDVSLVDANTDKEECLVENGDLQGRQQSVGKEPVVVDADEILEIIKEAGFRSSIPSSIARSKPKLTTPPPRLEESSSNFHGLGSSPPQVVTSPFEAQSRERTPSLAGTTEDQSKGGGVHYPQLSVPSSLVSSIADHGHQSDFPSLGEGAVHAFDINNFSGTQAGEAIAEPELPPAQSLGNNEARSTPPNPSSDANPPSSGLPSLGEIFSAPSDFSRLEQEAPRPLEPITDLSMETKVAEEYNKAMEELDASLDEVGEPDQVIPKESKESKSHGRKQFKISSNSPKRTIGCLKKSPTKKSRSAKSPKKNSEFVIPPGSQQVDLTLSNDEIEMPSENEFDEVYDDSFGLPSGPGWVDKKRHKSTSSIRPASQPTPYKSRLLRRTTMRF